MADDAVRGNRCPGRTRTDRRAGPRRLADRYPRGRRAACRRDPRGLQHRQIHPRLLGPRRCAAGDRRSDLFRAVRLPAVPPVGEIRRDGRTAAVAESLCPAPGSAHHARLRHHRADRLRPVSLPARGAEPWAHLVRTIPQPHADADLLQRLSGQVPASGPDPDVEPGGGGGLLPRAAAAGLPASRADQPAALAAQAGAGRLGGDDVDQPGLVDPGARRPTLFPTAPGFGCPPTWPGSSAA